MQFRHTVKEFNGGFILKREEFKNKYIEKVYLGDGLYASFDGYQITLTAPREFDDHYVSLEPMVFDNPLKYREELNKDASSIED